jgi:hypothetical protein
VVILGHCKADKEAADRSWFESANRKARVIWKKATAKQAHD